jgi:hypothetical protein
MSKKQEVLQVRKDREVHMRLVLSAKQRSTTLSINRSLRNKMIEKKLRKKQLQSGILKWPKKVTIIMDHLSHNHQISSAS